MRRQRGNSYLCKLCHLRLNSSPVNNIPDKSGEFLHKEITQQIIGAAFEVYKHMGYGYLEKGINAPCKSNYFNAASNRDWSIRSRFSTKALWSGIMPRTCLWRTGSWSNSRWLPSIAPRMKHNC